MILETVKTIAVKNNKGGYNSNKISVFNADALNVSFSCTQSKLNSGKFIIMRLNCPLCGGEHSYKYSIHDFFVRKLIVGGCEFTGMPLFYMGDYLKVQEKLSKISRIEKKVCAHI